MFLWKLFYRPIKIQMPYSADEDSVQRLAKECSFKYYLSFVFDSAMMVI